MTGSSDAERYLDDVRCARLEIRALNDERTHLWADVCGLRAVNPEREKISGGLPADLADAIVRWESRARRINRQLDALGEKIEEAEALIGRVGDATQRAVLRTYYINARSWQETARILHLSDRTTFYIRRRALAEFGRIYVQ